MVRICTLGIWASGALKGMQFLDVLLKSSHKYGVFCTCYEYPYCVLCNLGPYILCGKAAALVQSGNKEEVNDGCLEI
jgi:hypothetical protein